MEGVLANLADLERGLPLRILGRSSPLYSERFHLCPIRYLTELQHGRTRSIYAATIVDGLLLCMEIKEGT